MPDATRSGNSAASSLTVSGPRSARRSRMRRRVGSARTRNSSSLVLGTCGYEVREPLKDLVLVSTALVGLKHAGPAGGADAGEPVVREGHLGAGRSWPQGDEETSG